MTDRRCERQSKQAILLLCLDYDDDGATPYK